MKNKLHISAILLKLEELRRMNAYYIILCLFFICVLFRNEMVLWSIGLVFYICILNIISFFIINGLLDKYSGKNYDFLLTYEEYSHYFDNTLWLTMFLIGLIPFVFILWLILWEYNFLLFFLNNYFVFFMQVLISIGMIILTREIIRIFILELGLSRLLKNEIHKIEQEKKESDQK